MMMFQLKAVTRKIPASLALFLKIQLISRAAAMSLMAFALLLTAFDKASASQSPVVVAEKDPTSASICPTQLGSAIDAVINRPQFRRARWGI